MAAQETASGEGLIIIHAALYRMATRSLAEAYRILGYKAHHAHDGDVLEQRWDIIEQAAEATWPFIPGAQPRPLFKREDWEKLWDPQYEIVTDIASPFADQLVAIYPHAKVIVVQRDFESWWPSYKSECVDSVFDPLRRALLFLLCHVLGNRAGPAIRKVHMGFFRAGSPAEIERNARDGYERYFRRIRELVPPERRLEYKIGDGWGPLCAFLGKEVPDVPFPRLNDRKAHHESSARRKYNIVASSAKRMAPWLLAASVLRAAVWYSGH